MQVNIPVPWGMCLHSSSEFPTSARVFFTGRGEICPADFIQHQLEATNESKNISFEQNINKNYRSFGVNNPKLV